MNSLSSKIFMLCIAYLALACGYVTFNPYISSIFRSYPPIHSRATLSITSNRYKLDNIYKQKDYHTNQQLYSSSKEKQDGINHVSDVSKVLKAYRWTAWIALPLQTLLSLTSGTVISFTNMIRYSVSTPSPSVLSTGLSFIVTGLIFSIINCVWTWRALFISDQKSSQNSSKLSNTLKNHLGLSLYISWLGLFASLVAAEQVAVNFAWKALSYPYFSQMSELVTISSAQHRTYFLDMLLVVSSINAVVCNFLPLFLFSRHQNQVNALTIEDINNSAPIPSVVSNLGHTSHSSSHVEREE